MAHLLGGQALRCRDGHNPKAQAHHKKIHAEAVGIDGHQQVANTVRQKQSNDAETGGLTVILMHVGTLHCHTVLY